MARHTDRLLEAGAGAAAVRVAAGARLSGLLRTRLRVGRQRRGQQLRDVCGRPGHLPAHRLHSGLRFRDPRLRTARYSVLTLFLSV